MVFSKLRLSPGIAFAFLIACSWASQTLPVSSQEQQQPPADAAQAPAPDQAAPAAPADTLPPPSDGSTPPAAEQPAAPAPDGATAAPAPDAGTTATTPPDTSAPPSDSGAAQAPPAQPDQPAATAEPSQTPAPEAAPAGSINASQVAIGTAVYGADGAKIGEVNGVKSDDSGKIQEILVTDGVPAGMNAKVFEITADKIVSVSDGVKLSLSAEETKKLPIIDNSNG